MSTATGFSINGRFLTQSITGVQRYAYNVTSAIDARLTAQNASSQIVAPRGATDPGFHALPLVQDGSFSGHVWEQAILPKLWKGRLLNLCNTAPASKHDQIVCIHDANIFVSPDSYSYSFRKLYRLLQPRIVRHAVRVTTVSHASARQIARHLPVSVGRIAVLPNGHEHALAWDPGQAKIAPFLIGKAPAVEDRRFVLAIGSQARHKNLELLIDAAPGLAELGLDVVIAGGKDGLFTPETLKSAPNVRILGRVTDHDLAYLMERALCLVFPSWTEGFGLPIVEAMARGCPVISSDRASMPEVGGDAVLYAAPDDPAAWIRQIAKLAGSAQLQAELVDRGRERVQLFSWSDTAAGYLDLLQMPETSLPLRATEGDPGHRVAVVVATRGRPEVVSATLRYILETQTLKPDVVMVSCIDEKDAGDLVGMPGVTVITGPAGLPSQRNTALNALPPGIDIVAFFDDDFVPDRNWLAVAVRTFRDEANVASFTGRVLADGIKGPGLGFEDAVRIVEETGDSDCDWSWIEPYSPYGCNMAFRMSKIRDMKFDERLVLYGWLEDRDFAASVAKRGGRLAKCAEARGVHMGVKGGRVSGTRFGYSQIVNPIYMLRKGTMTLPQVADHILRNVASNLVLSARPEPFVDRRGRLKGNLHGCADVLRGRVEPERAAGIQA